MTTSKILTLPTELRNQIYELVFHAPTADPISLCKAAPPSGALLLVCQQFYNEASKMHKAACHAYWQKGRFFIDIFHFGEEQKTYLKSLRLIQIQYLELILHAHWPPPPGSDVAHTYTMAKTLVDRRGVWKRWFKLDGEASHSPWYRGLISHQNRVGEERIYSTPRFRGIAGVIAVCERSSMQPPSISAQVLYLLEADERLCRTMRLRKMEYTDVRG